MVCGHEAEILRMAFVVLGSSQFSDVMWSFSESKAGRNRGTRRDIHLPELYVVVVSDLCLSQTLVEGALHYVRVGSRTVFENDTRRYPMLAYSRSLPWSNPCQMVDELLRR